MSVAVLLLFYGLGAFGPERRSLWTLAAAVVITSANAWTKPGGGPSSVVPMELFAVLLPYVLGRMTSYSSRSSSRYGWTERSTLACSR